MLYYISVCIITVLAGIAHGVCGFGAGIVMMTVLPSFFSISQSAAIVGVVCIALTSLMILRYRKHVSPRKVILPLIVYSAASAAAIHFSSSALSTRRSPSRVSVAWIKDKYWCLCDYAACSSAWNHSLLTLGDDYKKEF